MPICYRIFFAILFYSASALPAQDNATRELIQAVEKGDVLTVKTLLKQGVDVHEAIPSTSPFYLFFLSREMYLNGLTGTMKHDPVYIAAIHANASRANDQMLKTLLRKRANIDAGDSEGKTPLMYALRSPGGEEYAMLLIRKGANYTTVDNAGNTAMHYAAFGGNLQGVQMTLTGGTDINIRNLQGITPLHAAAVRAELDMLQSMVDLKADILATDSAGMNVLHYAAGYSGADKLAWILEKAPGLQVASLAGMTPMDIAQRAGNLNAVEFLRSKGGKFREFLHQELLDAIQKKDFESVNRLLRAGAFPNRIQKEEPYSPLHLAISGQDLIAADLLIKAGADPNDQNEKGRTPIDLAFFTGNPQIVLSILQSNEARPTETHLLQALSEMAMLDRPGAWEDVVLTLIQKTKDLNKAGGKLNTFPLHYAAYLGHPQICIALLEAGADPSLKDPDGWTAMHWLVCRKDLLPRHPDKLVIAEVLLSKGCPLNVQSGKPKRLPALQDGQPRRVPGHCTPWDLLQYAIPVEQEMAEWMRQNNAQSTVKPEDWTENAAFLVQAKDFAQAKIELNKSIQAEPLNPNALYLRGECHRMLLQLENAEADYSEAIRLAGPQPEINFGRGKVRHDLGKPEGAILDFDIAVGSATLRAESLYWRGKCKLKKGARADACKDLNEALSAGYEGAAAILNLHCR